MLQYMFHVDFVDRIILVLDGDEAGQRRANEVLELFVAEKADLRIVTLPEGLDPADFLLEHGAEQLVCIDKDKKLRIVEPLEIEAYKQMPKAIHKAYQELHKEIQTLDLEVIKEAVKKLNDALGI